jgi:HPt (histidine-containing phosphotransfer) domain-containing protein
MAHRPGPSVADLKLLDPDGNFRDRLEADRQALAELSDSGDMDAFKRLVHGLAGAAGTFGYGEVGDIAIEIDEVLAAGRRADPSAMARLLAALEQALGKSKKSA